MNSNKYLMYSYVPVKPKCKLTKFYNLDDRLKEMTFNEIVENPQKHFKDVYVTNFDLIHHECRGDPLNYSQKFYKTIYADQLKQMNCIEKSKFVAAAITSRRDDVYLNKMVLRQHFDIELKLMERNIFLSTMKKNAFIRKKEQCNFLKADS